MAWFNKQHCRKCGEETQHNYNECLQCREREREEAEREWLALPLDEKLLDLRRRLIAVEAGPVRF